MREFLFQVSSGSPAILEVMVGFLQDLCYEVHSVNSWLGMFRVRVCGDTLAAKVWETAYALGVEITPLEVEGVPIDDGSFGVVFVPGSVGVPCPRSQE